MLFYAQNKYQRDDTENHVTRRTHERAKSLIRVEDLVILLRQ